MSTSKKKNGILYTIISFACFTVFGGVLVSLSTVLFIFGKIYGFEQDVKTFTKARKKYEPVADAELDPFECRPREVIVKHEVISGHRYGWFKEETYHVPLETGRTIVCRKRASRYQNTYGALLLIHGFAQNRFSWHTEGRSFVNHLAEAGYDVFFMDLRGTRDSRSLGAPSPKGIHEYIEIDVKQTLKLIRVVSQHSKVYLIGHSMGGAISCASAGKYSDIVGGVIHIAGVYGFEQNKNPIWKALMLVDRFVKKALPSLPKNFQLPTREFGHILSLMRFIVNSPLGIFIPFTLLVAGSVEMSILAKYFYTSFEPASLGVLQGLTDMAHGQPLLDENGKNYFQQFENRQIPLLVICADKDDLVNIKDSLKCFDSSNSRDKQKLVFVADATKGGYSFGHCDIIIGKDSVTQVWEKVRIWLDQRRKLGLAVGPEEKGAYFLPEFLMKDVSSDELVHASLDK